MSHVELGPETQHRLDALLSQPAGSHAGEYKVLKFRRHARHLVWCALIFIATSGAVAYFAGTFLEEWQNWAVLGGGALVVLLVVILPYLSWLGRTTTLTTRRIILRSGILTSHRTELPLAHIRELKLKRGPLQRLFGAGDIVLQSGVNDPVVLRNAPRVKLTARAIQELIEWHYASVQYAQPYASQQGSGQGFSGPSFAAG